MNMPARRTSPRRGHAPGQGARCEGKPVSKSKILSVALGASLVMGSVPTGAIAVELESLEESRTGGLGADAGSSGDTVIGTEAGASASEGQALEADASETLAVDDDAAGSETPDVDAGADERGGSAAGPETTRDAASGSASIDRDGGAVTYDTLDAAIKDARDGETILVSGELEVTGTITISSGRHVTLRATGACTVTRSDSFVQTGGKELGMIRLSGGSALTLESADPEAATLVFDGEDVDGNDAVITVTESSTLSMLEGTTIRRARCSLKPWAAVYVNSGTFVLDGGSLVDGFAMRNAAVAVERSASFEMRDGLVARN